MNTQYIGGVGSQFVQPGGFGTVIMTLGNSSNSDKTPRSSNSSVQRNQHSQFTSKSDRKPNTTSSVFNQSITQIFSPKSNGSRSSDSGLFSFNFKQGTSSFSLKGSRLGKRSFKDLCSNKGVGDVEQKNKQILASKPPSKPEKKVVTRNTNLASFFRSTTNKKAPNPFDGVNSSNENSLILSSSKDRGTLNNKPSTKDAIHLPSLSVSGNGCEKQTFSHSVGSKEKIKNGFSGDKTSIKHPRSNGVFVKHSKKRKTSYGPIMTNYLSKAICDDDDDDDDEEEEEDEMNEDDRDFIDDSCSENLSSDDSSSDFKEESWSEDDQEEEETEKSLDQDLVVEPIDIESFSSTGGKCSDHKSNSLEYFDLTSDVDDSRQELCESDDEEDELLKEGGDKNRYLYLRKKVFNNLPLYVQNALKVELCKQDRSEQEVKAILSGGMNQMRDDDDIEMLCKTVCANQYGYWPPIDPRAVKEWTWFDELQQRSSPFDTDVRSAILDGMGSSRIKLRERLRKFFKTSPSCLQGDKSFQQMLSSYDISLNEGERWVSAVFTTFGIQDAMSYLNVLFKHRCFYPPGHLPILKKLLHMCNGIHCFVSCNEKQPDMLQVYFMSVDSDQVKSLNFYVQCHMNDSTSIRSQTRTKRVFLKPASTKRMLSKYRNWFVDSRGVDLSTVLKDIVEHERASHQLLFPSNLIDLVKKTDQVKKQAKQKLKK